MAARTAKSTPGRVTSPTPAEAAITRRARAVLDSHRVMLSPGSGLTPAAAAAITQAQRDALEDHVRPLVPKAIRKAHGDEFWNLLAAHLRVTMQMQRSEFDHLTDAQLVAHLERLNAQSERRPRTPGKGRKP